MSGPTTRNELAGRRGYSYKLTRRQFLVASSATASATAAATAAKPLKLGQLLPFTKVYAELGNSMKRATDLYIKSKGGKFANRPVPSPIYEDEANDPQVGLQKTQKFIDQDQVDIML